MFLCLALAFVAGLIAFYNYFTRTFSYWKIRNVKHPTPVLLFGNIMESALNRKHYFEILRDIYQQFPKEKVVGIYRMTTPCLLIRDLDVIKQVLIKDFDKFIDRGVAYSKEGLGTNLLHSEGDTWRFLRRKITPMFTSSKLRNMFHLLTGVSDKFVEYVCEENQKQEELESASLVQRFFVASVSACAFGLDVDFRSKDQEAQLHKIDESIFRKTFFHELDMMYPGLLLKANFSLFPKLVTTFFNDIVKLVIAERNGVPSNRRDLIDLLLDMKNKEDHTKNKDINDEVSQLEISDSLIAAQIFIFYSAGYETSATAMVCMLYCLAQHQDIQGQVHAEIEQVLNKYNGELTYDAINEMIYLEKVFYETLRMYAIADNIFRKAVEDYPIPGTDVIVARGQTVIFSGFGIHYDEKYYPNPDKFDPERFSPENLRNRHPCTMMSFGIGPRNCIGMRFSKVAIAVCAVKILSKFRVRPSTNTPEKIKYDPSRFLMLPKERIPLIFVPKRK